MKGGRVRPPFHRSTARTRPGRRPCGQPRNTIIPTADTWLGSFDVGLVSPDPQGSPAARRQPPPAANGSARGSTPFCTWSAASVACGGRGRALAGCPGPECGPERATSICPGTLLARRPALCLTLPA